MYFRHRFQRVRNFPFLHLRGGGGGEVQLFPYENMPMQICRKFHFQKLKNFR